MWAYASANRLICPLPLFLDVVVDPNEHVYPMAIKGGAMSDMVLSRTDDAPRMDPQGGAA